MNPLRIDVTVRGTHWVGETHDPPVTAVAASAAQAAENVRLAALAIYSRMLRPSMVLVRIEEPETSTMLMQPMDEPVSLEPSNDRRKWRYMASVKKNEPAGESGQG